MNIERLRNIIAYSDYNREEIYSLVRHFGSFAGIDYDSELLNIMQIVRSAFLKKGYYIFELPFDDDEIGALCYKGDGFKYVVVNTSLPRVNMNFAIAHEVYHVFFGETELVSKVEFSDDNYYEHEEEYAANLFAGMLLMPEASFRKMYLRFKDESAGNEFNTIIQLMAYYQVPYMSVFIRCLELKLVARSEISDNLLGTDREYIRKKLADLWLDDSIMEATKRDDFRHIEKIVKKTGEKYIEEGYINRHVLSKALANMHKLYDEIREK